MGNAMASFSVKSGEFSFEFGSLIIQGCHGLRGGDMLSFCGAFRVFLGRWRQGRPAFIVNRFTLASIRAFNRFCLNQMGFQITEHRFVDRYALFRRNRLALKGQQAITLEIPH